MKVSVIIPIYNVEAYLNRCIQSIIGQTYTDLEIILVDDGSPDKCPQICDDYAKKDNRIKVIHKENVGQGLARNDGLSIATGDYVAFVDSDDFLAINAIEKMIKASDNGTHDIVFAAMYNMWTPKKGGCISYALDEIDDTPHAIAMALADLTSSPWENEAPAFRSMGACGAIIRNDVIQNNNLKFLSERKVMAEDMLFLYDLFAYVHSIRYIPTPLYYYCLNVVSTSHTFKVNYIDAIENLAKVLRNKKLAKDNAEVQQRITKWVIYKYGILQSQILQAKIPIMEKWHLSKLIYNKTALWNDINENYAINSLPHSYRYYLSIFMHRRFFMGLIRQKAYVWKNKILK